MKDKVEHFSLQRAIHEYAILQDDESLETVVSRFRHSNTFISHRSEVIPQVILANATDKEKAKESYERVIETYIDTFKTMFLEKTHDDIVDSEEKTVELFNTFKNSVVEKEVERMVNTFEHLEKQVEEDVEYNELTEHID